MNSRRKVYQILGAVDVVGVFVVPCGSAPASASAMPRYRRPAADHVHPSTVRVTHLWTSCVYRWWMCARLGGVRVEVDVVQVVSDAVFVIQFSPAGNHRKFAGSAWAVEDGFFDSVGFGSGDDGGHSPCCGVA